MKRIVFVAVVLNFVGGALQASGMISCSGDAAAVNSCYASNLPAFNTRLDWAVFGTPDGSIYNGVWTTNSNGMNISVQGQGLGANAGLRLADNYGSVFVSGQWVMPTVTPNTPYAFSGHFDAPPDTMPGSAVTPGDPGDHLLGLALTGVPMSPTTALLINSQGSLNSVGFRIASVTNSTFDARVRLFSGIDGTGTMLLDTTFANLSGGGTCSTLFVITTNPPSPCNNAPFLAMTNYGTIKSVMISTPDVTGFYLSSLQISEVPEPSPMILGACGIALLWIGRKKWRRA